MRRRYQMASFPNKYLLLLFDTHNKAIRTNVVTPGRSKYFNFLAYIYNYPTLGSSKIKPRMLEAIKVIDKTATAPVGADQLRNGDIFHIGPVIETRASQEAVIAVLTMEFGT